MNLLELYEFYSVKGSENSLSTEFYMFNIDFS